MRLEMRSAGCGLEAETYCALLDRLWPVFGLKVAARLDGEGSRWSEESSEDDRRRDGTASKPRVRRRLCELAEGLPEDDEGRERSRKSRFSRCEACSWVRIKEVVYRSWVSSRSLKARRSGADTAAVGGNQARKCTEGGGDGRRGANGCAPASWC